MYKFDDCKSCLFKSNTLVCEQCGCGEMFESDDELNLESEMGIDCNLGDVYDN